jgi:hypothetical protein
MPDVVMVAAGLGNLAAITSAGALLRWRRNNDGKRKRGQGDREDRLVRRGGIRAQGHIVACGGAHSVTVTEEGALWPWGCGDRGRLAPARVGLLSGSAAPRSSAP